MQVPRDHGVLIGVISVPSASSSADVDRFVCVAQGFGDRTVNEVD